MQLLVLEPVRLLRSSRRVHAAPAHMVFGRRRTALSGAPAGAGDGEGTETGCSQMVALEFAGAVPRILLSVDGEARGCVLPASLARLGTRAGWRPGRRGRAASP